MHGAARRARALDDSLIPEVRKLTKDAFDIDSVVSAAEELKYIGELKRVLSAQFKSPDAEWIRFLATRVYSGSFTQRVKEQFTPLVQKSLKQFLSDQVNERIKTALGSQGYLADRDDASVSAADASEHVAQASTMNAEAEDDGIETTLEELEAFQIVRAIACSEVPASRIAQRDTKSYFGVLLDDNNRKPIVRLYFNTAQHYIGIFDADKSVTKYPIDINDDIYDYAEQIRAAAVVSATLGMSS